MTTNQTAEVDLTNGVYKRIYCGFIHGERINKLSWKAEAYFWRVFAVVDDFGNHPADPERCRDATRGKRKLTASEVDRLLHELYDASLVNFYWVKGERYLHINGYDRMQPGGRNGRKVRRFLGPEHAGGKPVHPGASGESKQHNDHDQNNHHDHHQDKIQPPYGGIEFLTALAEFEEWRKKKRAPLTDGARLRLYRRLEAWSEERATAAICFSIDKGWIGVYEEKKDNEGNRHGSQSGVSEGTLSAIQPKRIIDGSTTS